MVYFIYFNPATKKFRHYFSQVCICGCFVVMVAENGNRWLCCSATNHPIPPKASCADMVPSGIESLHFSVTSQNKTLSEENIFITGS